MESKILMIVPFGKCNNTDIIPKIKYNSAKILRVKGKLFATLYGKM